MSIKVPKVTGSENVLKHDDIVRLGREFEGIGESRFLNCCLVGFNNYELLDEVSYYPVDIQRYAERASIHYSVAYQEVKEFAIKHMEETLFIKLANGATWGTPLIYDIEFCDTNKYLKIKWNKEVIPLISGKIENGKFLRYDARMDATSSNKVYLLSELIQKNMYRLYKFPEYAIVLPTIEIREVTGTLDLYKDYKDLNKRVIQPTLLEIAKIMGIKLNYKGNKRIVKLWRDRNETV
jgi:plasmid replication initiation protein